MGFSFLASKILGLIRDNLLAATFGATIQTGINKLDIYYAAFRLPDLLFNLLSFGILSAAFVPVFVEILKKEGDKSANRYANEIFKTFGILILGISAVMWIFAPYFVKLFVPGFEQGDINTTVQITRIMLVTPFFFTIGSIAGGIQNAYGKFWGLALAPILYNLAIIGGILFLSKDYGIYGVAIGVVIGAMLNMCALLPGIIKKGFYLEHIRTFFTQRVKETIRLSVPRIIGMSTAQLALVIGTVIASTLADGSITIMNFAVNLQSLPIGLIGISVAIVSFGTLSSHFAENKILEFKTEISKNIRRILFLLIPSTIGMLILRTQIVTILYGRGKFNATDILLTSNTLGVLLCGTVFGGLVFILARGFYAMKNTKTPVIIGISAITINILASIFFTQIIKWNIYGIAIGTALADTINAVALLILLQKKLHVNILEYKEILKFLFAGVIMGIFVKFAVTITQNTYLQVSLSAITGIFIYLTVCGILKCKDTKFLV